MAVWLAEQVGPTGRVVATDIDLTYLSRLDLPNLEVVEHNILEDSLAALEPGSFDLVCSRLMLFHIVGRQEAAIGRMVECLRPGGWLVDEDADWGTTGPVDRSTRFTAGFTPPGGMVTGGPHAGTTLGSGERYRRCSSGRVWRRSSTKHRPRWCAEGLRGRAGTERASMSFTSSVAAPEPNPSSASTN
jgi:SAM-dependent methyltransferase